MIYYSGAGKVIEAPENQNKETTNSEHKKGNTNVFPNSNNANIILSYQTTGFMNLGRYRMFVFCIGITRCFVVLV